MNCVLLYFSSPSLQNHNTANIQEQHTNQQHWTCSKCNTNLLASFLEKLQHEASCESVSQIPGRIFFINQNYLYISMFDYKMKTANKILLFKSLHRKHLNIHCYSDSKGELNKIVTLSSLFDLIISYYYMTNCIKITFAMEQTRNLFYTLSSIC